MSDRTAFYQAIWAAPDDDLPRMVFADWLDEHHDPDAAHFLRLLCACRTCPPDVYQIRPLVAQLRRTMVKLPPEFVENACPVPPAVVIGPWVDVDHEANRGVLEWCRENRNLALRGVHKLDQADFTQRWNDSHPDSWNQRVESHLTKTLPELLPELRPCLIEGNLSLTHAWSGVVMAVYHNRWYVMRKYHPKAPSDPNRPHTLDEDWVLGIDPDTPQDDDDPSYPDNGWPAVIRFTCRWFDPAHQPV